jgi:hypothetical protein
MKTGYGVKGREVVYEERGKAWPVFRDVLGYYRLDFEWDA